MGNTIHILDTLINEDQYSKIYDSIGKERLINNHTLSKLFSWSENNFALTPINHHLEKSIVCPWECRFNSLHFLLAYFQHISSPVIPY